MIIFENEQIGISLWANIWFDIIFSLAMDKTTVRGGLFSTPGSPSSTRSPTTPCPTPRTTPTSAPRTSWSIFAGSVASSARRPAATSTTASSRSRMRRPGGSSTRPATSSWYFCPYPDHRRRWGAFPPPDEVEGDQAWWGGGHFEGDCHQQNSRMIPVSAHNYYSL